MSSCCEKLERVKVEAQIDIVMSVVAQVCDDSRFQSFTKDWRGEYGKRLAWHFEGKEEPLSLGDEAAWNVSQAVGWFDEGRFTAIDMLLTDALRLAFDAARSGEAGVVVP